MFVETKAKFVEPDLRSLKREYPPFSLQSLIAWLEAQDPDEIYCFTSPGNCLWGRYTRAQGGFADFNVCPGVYRIGANELAVGELDNGPLQRVAIVRPRTFGAALKRAQAALERLS